MKGLKAIFKKEYLPDKQQKSNEAVLKEYEISLSILMNGKELVLNYFIFVEQCSIFTFSYL